MVVCEEVAGLGSNPICAVPPPHMTHYDAQLLLRALPSPGQPLCPQPRLSHSVYQGVEVLTPLSECPYYKALKVPE